MHMYSNIHHSAGTCVYYSAWLDALSIRHKYIPCLEDAQAHIHTHTLTQFHLIVTAKCLALHEEAHTNKTHNHH